MNKITTTLSLLLLFIVVGCAGGGKDLATTAMPTIEKQMDNMISQIEATNSITYPRSIAKDKVRYVGGADWTIGFFPGSLWYMSQLSENSEKWAKQAEKYTNYLDQTQYLTSTHDIGFMMMCSFGNGFRFNDRTDYIPDLIQSARSLMARFHEKAGVLQSWDKIIDPAKEDRLCKVIIDNMMNLELLFEATALTGDSTYYKAAVKHADATMANHFRDDFSSYHLLLYDLKTGKVVKKQTHQGWKDDSAWARGQAWGLYGYTMSYRYTKDPRYLDMANKIAKFMIAESEKIEDGIFYWDFNYPKSKDTFRDASAAAITASALYELNDYMPNNGYNTVADHMLASLSSPEYLASNGDNKNFLIKHCVGHFPQQSELDVPINYADYYYLEALYRQKQMNKGQKIGYIAKTLAPNTDRADWLSAMDKISRPLLENFAAGTLIKNMPVEHSFRKSVTHLEAIGRLITGIAPWLESTSGDEKEVALRKEYQQMIIKGLKHAVTPNDPDYIKFNVASQNLVDAAFLSQGLLRARTSIWDKLDKETQEGVIASFKDVSKFKAYMNNWLLFSALVEIGLHEFSGSWDVEKVQFAIDKHSEWYKGDGFYGDGPNFHADYYNSFVIHPMLLFCTEYMESQGIKTKLTAKEEAHRMGRYAEFQERLISPEGTFPMFGRSICYRFGAFYALSDASYRKILPYWVKPAQVRSGLTAIINRQINAEGTFDNNGWLKLGFFGSQPSVAEGYISTGSLYLCSAVFPALGLPTDDPFWSDPFTEWTNLKGWRGKYVKIDKSR